MNLAAFSPGRLADRPARPARTTSGAREPAFHALKGDAELARLLADTERRHREAADAFAAANGHAIVAENI